MTFALEPKFVFPSEGAVGLENTYLVTESGFEKLTLMEEGIIACDAQGEEGR
jgi:Xaa-Pro aminopeptidase